MKLKHRIEEDLLGKIQVPEDVYYGAQTQRAVNNFPVKNGKQIAEYPVFIGSLLMVKKAAALANSAAGHLEGWKAEAICTAVDKVIKDEMYSQFPINTMHGGGGTSCNMNANEVLANIAEEATGGRKGDYIHFKPNDDVNMNQSTNDVIPTACHLAIIKQWDSTQPLLNRLADSLSLIGDKYEHEKRLSRTCLQDAVVTTYQNLFSGYAGFVERAINRINSPLSELYRVNLGGTIVGTVDVVPEDYFNLVIEELRTITGSPQFVRADNLFDAAQNMDDMIAVSSALNLMARGLIKISKDIRLLSSGPEAGVGEIFIPPVQPGSSIMPGKVNPVIPEFVIQLCFQVCGKHAACEAALDHGELDLNVWESLVVFNILDSMSMLSNAAETLVDLCISGITVNLKKNDRHVNSIIPLLTDLMKVHGYSKISELCKQADGDIVLLRRLLKDSDLI